MADTNKKFKISVNTEDVKKSLNTIKDDLKDVGKKITDGITKPFKAFGKNIQAVGSNIKNALLHPFTTLGKVGSAALKGIGNVGSKAFKGIGVAIKGAGIGLLIGMLASLWEALKKNQKIMDLFEQTVNMIGFAIKPLVDAVVSFTDKLKENKELLDATKSVIGNLLTIALTPLKLSFYAIKLALQQATLMWKESFLGGKGKDVEGIENLRKEIDETKASIKDVAVEAVDAGKEFSKNIGGVVQGISTLVKDVVAETKEAYKNLSFDMIASQAKAMVEAKKTLERLRREQENIRKNAELAAEEAKQARDDENNSFEDRIAANIRLSEILAKQQEDERRILQEKIKNQEILNSLDDDEAGLNALLDLKNQLADADLRYTRTLSEQKKQDVALTKQQIAFEKTLSEAKSLSAFELQKFHANFIKNEEEKLEKLKEIQQAEYEANKAILDNKIENLEKGSVAWYEAKNAEIELEKNHTLTMLGYQDQLHENALKNKEEEYKLEEEHLAKRKNQALDGIAYINNLDEQATQFRSNLLANQLKNGKITQEQYDKKLAEIEIKAAKRKKAYAIAETIVNTAASIMGIWKDVPKVDYGVSAALLSGAVGLMGAAQIATIASTPINGGGGGGGGSAGSIPTGGANAAQAPSTSFTFDEIKPQPTQTPVIKTYVVSGDIRTQDEMDRKIIANGSI